MSNTDQPMALDSFLLWCQRTLGLTFVPEPEAKFRSDFNLDDLEMFSFVLEFNGLVEDHSTVRPDVYESMDTIRDLYLYYLMIMSMPRG